jgi:TIR domain.
MNTVKRRRAFVSYSRKDKDFALEFAREMKSTGYLVWLDQLDIPTGARWDDEVEKALRECEIFLIILTTASVSSDNVKDEIGYAIDHGKRIMPVLLENCEIPLRLRRFQYVDFTTVEFNEGIKRAKQLLETLLNEQSTPVVIVDPELEPQTASNRGATPAPRLPDKKNRVQRRRVSFGAGICSLAICLGMVGAIFIFRDFMFLLTPTQVPTDIVTISPSPLAITQSFTPTVLISTPSPITMSNCSLNIGQEVNLRKNVRYWTKPNVLEAQFSPEQPEISVYILSGPIWGRVRADIDYSGWWWEVSASENGTSLGWVWEMGFEECN